MGKVRRRSPIATSIARALGIGRSLWLMPLDLSFRLVGLRYRWLKSLFDRVPPKAVSILGRIRAERAAWRAVQRVPAYRAFLDSAQVRPDRLVPWNILSHLPETDKRSYIDRFPIAERCVDGRIPFRGTTIDESSGSTGKPYNWIRAEAERHIAHRNISFFARHCFGADPLVTINAFSMGAWATGFNMSLALNQNGIVKSTGPDVEKILSTLRFLGPRYRYLICGYPPFLKHLLDCGDVEGFPWDTYRLHGLVGGEGMVEELRDYLLGRFSSVFSGYGATDIEIGMAGESPSSVAIRRVCRARPELRRTLFGEDSRLPMIFQYIPLIHYLEINQEGEIVCTISRLDVLAPRVRYNVHDEGGLVSYSHMAEVMRASGLDLTTLGRQPDAYGPRGALPWTEPVRLPYLYVYGRRDETISVMGANIYPEDVETVLYRDPEIARRIHSFCLAVVSDAAGTPRPEIALELNANVVVDSDSLRRIESHLRSGLADLNLDYRTALAEFPEAMSPVVTVHDMGHGPFAADAGRIKQRRVIRT